LSQFTRLTDGQTAFSSLDHVCITCSAVKSSNEIRFGDLDGWLAPPTAPLLLCVGESLSGKWCVMSLIVDAHRRRRFNEYR